MAYRKRNVRKTEQKFQQNEDEKVETGRLKDRVLSKKEEIITDTVDEISVDKKLENESSKSKDKDMKSKDEIKIDENVIRSKKEESKQLVEILKTKEEHQKEIQYEILQKTIPTFEPKESILKKIEDIKPEAAKKQSKLFRIFEPKQLPIYRQNGERELRNRWYWKLKKDSLPDGDYNVREYFLNLYDRVLMEMPDYLLLKDMAVDNKNSRDAGKVVDSETATICDHIFQDEETEGAVRRFIAEMRQRVEADRNVVNYPSILHPIDYAFNEYFLQHQLVEPLNNDIIFNYIPERIRNDSNYILNMDRNLPSTARYIRPNLLQDRLNLHDNFESIWDTITTANYILARSVVPDLKELVSTEAQIQKMSQDLQLEALTIQSETQFLTGINSQAANDCFKSIIAAMLSQRTISLDFVTTNYMSLISGMWLLTIVPNDMFLRESLVACQLAIVNTIIYPAFGMQRMHYRNGDPQTPFQIAEQQIQNFQVANWLHFVNHNNFRPAIIDGVLNQTLNDNIRSGQVVNQLMEALMTLARQQFPTMPVDYKRSIQRGILLLSNRLGQLVDLTRLLSYNYETLMACITMNMQHVQTLTTEKLQLTSVTSLCMLIGNATVIPSPQVLFHYYNVNVNFHSNYNEQINNTVAIIVAAGRLNLYQKKVKSIVEEFLKRLHIFDVPRVPDDQMYRLRDRLRMLPVERRRLDIFNLVLMNMEHIERASDKIAQGVIIAYQEMQLERDEMYGYVNIARDLDGYQQINLEELMRSGDYSQITNMLLNNQPVALVGALPFMTDSSVISLIAKLDATVFAQIVKLRKIDTLKPIMYKINSDSNDFYLVANYNWVPTSTTKVYKQVPQEFDFRASMHMLTSNLTFTVYSDLLAFVSADTVEPINAVAFDHMRIMNEL
ncbi:VP2 [Rotavirus A]|uniref:Inner capsid protein VP2 n=1 Tax=Rotavirus A TaxID=28875 RepID=A0A2D0VZS0_9REOV|nr:VP2 [Rotavirus A]